MEDELIRILLNPHWRLSRTFMHWFTSLGSRQSDCSILTHTFNTKHLNRHRHWEYRCVFMKLSVSPLRACHRSGCLPGSLCCLCHHVFFSGSWQVQSALIWQWGCACHKLLLFHLSLTTLSFIFLLLIVLVVSRLSLCSVIMLCSGVTHIYFVCTPWRVERRTAALCLAPLLGGYSCASAGSWSVISLLGRHLAADRSWITPENCSLFSLQFIFVVCTIGE